MRYIIKVQLHSFACGCQQFSQHCFLKRLSLLCWTIMAHLLKISWPQIWGLFLNSSVPLICVCLCGIPHGVDDCSSINLVIRQVWLLQLYCPFSVLFGFSASLDFSYKFWDEFFYFCKIVIGILIGITLNK